MTGSTPCWLHNKAASDLGRTLPGWIWWQAKKPPCRRSALKDIIEEESEFDKDTVLRLIPERHQAKLNEHDTVYATGYRRTRHGEQQLELRFDGIAGYLYIKIKMVEQDRDTIEYKINRQLSLVRNCLFYFDIM